MKVEVEVSMVDVLVNFVSSSNMKDSFDRDLTLSFAL